MTELHCKCLYGQWKPCISILW